MPSSGSSSPSSISTPRRRRPCEDRSAGRVLDRSLGRTLSWCSVPKVCQLRRLVLPSVSHPHPNPALCPPRVRPVSGSASRGKTLARPTGTGRPGAQCQRRRGSPVTEVRPRRASTWWTGVGANSCLPHGPRTARPGANADRLHQSPVGLRSIGSPQPHECLDASASEAEGMDYY